MARILLLLSLFNLPSLNAQENASVDIEAEQGSSSQFNAIQEIILPEHPPLVQIITPKVNSLSAKETQGQNSRECFFWGDNCAQWSMAIAAALAFLVSTYVAWLLRKTLKATEGLLIETKNTTGATLRAANSAVASNSPYLSPVVTGLNALHPMSISGEVLKIRPSVAITFENHGPTPAIVKEVRATIALTENDHLPDFNESLLGYAEYSEVVGGNTRGTDALKAPQVKVGSVEEVVLTKTEFQELLAETKGGNYKRFYLLGIVTYDDVFNQRHRRRFCLKLRRVPPGGNTFAAFKGGTGYNRVDREEIPIMDI